MNTSSGPAGHLPGKGKASSPTTAWSPLPKGEGYITSSVTASPPSPQGEGLGFPWGCARRRVSEANRRRLTDEGSGGQ